MTSTATACPAPRRTPADGCPQGARPAQRMRSTVATAGFASAAMLVSYLPFSAVNGALGAIGAGAHASTAQLQWVTDAFTVALTAALLFGGVAAERRGRRRLTVVGLGLTVLGSVLGWIAGGLRGVDSVHLLWEAQAIAGAGGGLVMSASLSLIATTVSSPASRARWIAVWAAGNVIGLGMGPFLAGAATALVAGPDAWRWLFPPVVALALLVAAFGLCAAREARAVAAPRTDPVGQVLGTVGVLALVSGVIDAGSDGLAAPAAAGGLIAGVVLLGGFLLWERRAASPTLRPALFASAGFSAATLAAAAVLFTVIAVVFVSSLGFTGQGIGSFGVATRIGCLFLGNAVASVVAGRLNGRFDPRGVLVAGLVVTAGGLGTLLVPGSGADLASVGWRLALTGTGCGVVVATSTVVALRSVPADLTGMAAIAHNVVRQLGGALGAAVVGGVLASRLAAGVDPATATRACMAFLLVLVLFTTVTTAVLFGRHRRTS